MPILVGGTHYYIQSLLWPSSLLDAAATMSTPTSDRADGTPVMTAEDLPHKYPILCVIWSIVLGIDGSDFKNRNAPTPQLLEHLQAVDPVMAARWHPNDRRKILRSLEIYYLNNCTPASAIYRIQQEQKSAAASALAATGHFRNLIFWVHAEPTVLDQRLEARVDTMVRAGLYEEIEELWGYYRTAIDAGDKLDMQRGLWQSIGFKEFLPWLQKRHELTQSNGGKLTQLEQEELMELKEEGLRKMKTATKQYARTQVNWIRIKLMNAINEANEASLLEPHVQPSGSDTLNDSCSQSTTSSSQLPNILYLLNSSNVSEFDNAVLDPAIDIAKKFLDSSSALLPEPGSLSDLAREYLKPKRTYDMSTRPDLWVKKTCEICGVTTVDQIGWELHEKSNRHKRNIRAKKKRAEGLMWKEKREREARNGLKGENATKIQVDGINE